jgi:D-amino-acid dehydrogenase
MKEVVVIGAGVIGLCSAYYAARRGFQVTVIDRNNEASEEGCSYGNAGMIVPSHFVPLAAPGAVMLGLKWMWNPESPFWIKPRLDWDLFDWGFKFWRASNAIHVDRAAPVLRDLHLASRQCFEELAANCSNEFGLVQRGLLALCKTGHALEEEAGFAEKARRLGVPAEVLNPKDLAKIEPGARIEAVGAIYFPKDCHLTPARFMARMRRLIAEAGVRFLSDTEVTGVKKGGTQIRALITTNGEIHGDEFILCGGSWSTAIGREIGLKLPLQAGKGYSLTLGTPPALPTICSILVEARVAVTPMGNTVRVGGTMEMAGLTEDVNRTRVVGIVKAMAKYYPEFEGRYFDGIKPWRGLRPVSPDGLPYLGRARDCKNLIVATGHAMMGLSLGPVTGKIVAEILAEEKPSVDLQLLNPNRYA